MKELLMLYADMFDENFPTRTFNGTEEEMIETIKKCIKDKTPYKERDIDTSIDY